MLRYGLCSLLFMFMLTGCAASMPPIRTEASVDLSKFMGDWYVIANIPTFIEKGRQQRDYVWIMARTPQIPDADYQALLTLLADEGYDISKIQKVPQQWPEP